jgi:hypothetical protein
MQGRRCVQSGKHDGDNGALKAHVNPHTSPATHYALYQGVMGEAALRTTVVPTLGPRAE